MTLDDNIKFIVIDADLDVDSDNDDNFAAPERDLFEDHFEDIEGYAQWPGARVVVNEKTADGFEHDFPFTPMVFEIPEPINLQDAQIRFVYSATAPYGLPGSTTHVDGPIRLWTANVDVAANKGPWEAGGVYVDPDVTYTWDQLSSNSDYVDGRKITLFVEGVNARTSPARLRKRAPSLGAPRS